MNASMLRTFGARPISGNHEFGTLQYIAMATRNQLKETS